MNLITGFECGAGKPSQLNKCHWRIDTLGDAYGADRYFLVCIDATDEDMDQRLLIEVWPDPNLGERSNLMTHFPSHIWYSREDTKRWIPLRHTWENSVKFHDNHFELSIPVAAEEVLYVGTNVPFPYSRLMTWCRSIEQKAGEKLRLESIGNSYENRIIPAIRLGSGDGQQPRMLVLAGMHSSEHGGVFAAQGIVEFLLSRISEAKRIVDAFDIAVVPMFNVDGNVQGYSGGNAQRLDVNISLDFHGLADGQKARTHENNLLWEWLSDGFDPDLSLQFHCYQGWKRNADYPYDGVYALDDPETLYKEAPSRLEIHRAIFDRLTFETDAHSAHWSVVGSLREAFLEYQMAKLWRTVCLLYEINVGSVGPYRQYQRGPEVLRALVRAVLDDCGGIT